jgi:branched-chain amino acid transport system permease protein
VLLGVAESLVSGLFIPGMRDAVSFIVLVAVLVLRPRGLFGNRYLLDPRV